MVKRRASIAGKCRLYSLVLIIAALAACSPPMGGIGGGIGGSSAGSGNFDGIEVVPQRTTFRLLEVFRRTSSYLRVFATLDGERQFTVSPGSCDIYIIEDRENPTERKPVGSGHPLEKLGENFILVEYRGFPAEYRIMVQESIDGNTDSGIQITGP